MPQRGRTVGTVHAVEGGNGRKALRLGFFGHPFVCAKRLSSGFQSVVTISRIQEYAWNWRAYDHAQLRESDTHTWGYCSPQMHGDTREPWGPGAFLVSCHRARAFSRR